MAKYNLTINGKKQSVDVSEDTPLLWVLRDNLGLLGAKFGCGIAECGACTVHMDGEAIKACVYPVSSVNGAKITTIEGLSEKGDHPVQTAWDELDVPQCGYCQAGQIMTAAAFLKKNKKPSAQQIDEAMHGNICRCCAYHRIRDAVKYASEKM